jgi:hypothetical protein
MSKFSFMVKFLAISIFMLAFFSIAQAQATRTWVSGVGDDANPCSRTAPCKTFAGAISKTAAGGEIDVLDPGGFGAVTITKSISIEADGLIAGVLVSGTNGIVVQAGPNDVVMLRGLTIEGLGTGVSGVLFNSGGALHVVDCHIHGFSGKGVDFGPNQAGISKLFVDDSFVRENAGGGIYVHIAGGGGSATASIDNTRLENNLFGLRNDDSTTVSVNRSVSAGNTNNGFLGFSASSASVLTITNSVASSNGVYTGSAATSAGIRATGAFTSVKITGNTISGNLNGILADGSANIFSFGCTPNRNADNGSPNGTVIPCQ